MRQFTHTLASISVRLTQETHGTGGGAHDQAMALETASLKELHSHKMCRTKLEVCLCLSRLLHRCGTQPRIWKSSPDSDSALETSEAG